MSDSKEEEEEKNLKYIKIGEERFYLVCVYIVLLLLFFFLFFFLLFFIYKLICIGWFWIQTLSFSYFSHQISKYRLRNRLPCLEVSTPHSFSSSSTAHNL